MSSPFTRTKPDFGNPEVRGFARGVCAREGSAALELSAMANSGVRASLISSLLAQRALEVVQQVLRAALALGQTITPVEVDSLLDEAHVRASAECRELQRSERHGDAPSADLHRVAPDASLVRNDVVIDRVVAMWRMARGAAAPHLAAADAEVACALGDLPSFDAAEPACLLLLVGERR